MKKDGWLWSTYFLVNLSQIKINAFKVSYRKYAFVSTCLTFYSLSNIEWFNSTQINI